MRQQRCRSPQIVQTCVCAVLVLHFSTFQRILHCQQSKVGWLHLSRNDLGFSVNLSQASISDKYWILRGNTSITYLDYFVFKSINLFSTNPTIRVNGPRINLFLTPPKQRPYPFQWVVAIHWNQYGEIKIRFPLKLKKAGWTLLNEACARGIIAKLRGDFLVHPTAYF